MVLYAKSFFVTLHIMNVDFRRSSHVWFFAAFLPAVSYGVGWAFVHVFPSLPFWVEGLSPLTAYGLLFGFFDRVAWRWKIFRLLHIVTVPDLRGRWLGEQTSSFVRENGKHATSRVIIEITQTFSSLQVATYYHRWSTKISAAQFVEYDHSLELVIMFDAEPKTMYEEQLDGAHKGVTKLRYMPDGVLRGDYFNAAGRHGEVTYKRTGYKLTYHF